MTNPQDNAYNGTVRVEVVNHADVYAKPRFVHKSTMHTYLMDPNGQQGNQNIQVCGYEPDRIRTVFRVYDEPVALCMEKPNVSPDTNATSGGLYVPQGHLMVNGLTPYEFFGPDALWINTVAQPLVSNPNQPNITQVVGASGADAVVNVGFGGTWNLIAVDATLVTSATVGNRTPSLIIDDNNGHVIWQSPAQAVQAASLTVSYPFSVGGQGALALPPILLGLGWRIRTSTAGIAAGDVWTVVAEYGLTASFVGATRVAVLREYC